MTDEQLSTAAAELDDISTRFFAALKDPEAAAVSKAILLAKSIKRMRALLTQPLMESLFMPLMNSALGFMTDRTLDAKRDDRRLLYSWDVVRDCLIDAMLSGFKPTGNEFNIISARTMGVLNGWRRLVQDIPGISDLDVRPGLPVLRGESPCVRVAGDWKLNGTPYKLVGADGQPGISFMLDVKGGFGGGPDALAGKAMRRAYKAIYQKITGTVHTLPDGDVGEGAEPPAKPASPPLTRTSLRPPTGNGTEKPPPQTGEESQTGDLPHDQSEQPNYSDEEEINEEEKVNFTKGLVADLDAAMEEVRVAEILGDAIQAKDWVGHDNWVQVSKATDQARQRLSAHAARQRGKA